MDWTRFHRFEAAVPLLSFAQQWRLALSNSTGHPLRNVVTTMAYVDVRQAKIDRWKRDVPDQQLAVAYLQALQMVSGLAIFGALVWLQVSVLILWLTAGTKGLLFSAAGVFVGVFFLVVAVCASRRQMWALRVGIYIGYVLLGCTVFSLIVSAMANPGQPAFLFPILMCGVVLLTIFQAKCVLRRAESIVGCGGTLSLRNCRICESPISMSSDACPVCTQQPRSHASLFGGILLIAIAIPCWIKFASYGAAFLGALFLGPFAFGFAFLAFLFGIVAIALGAWGTQILCRHI